MPFDRVVAEHGATVWRVCRALLDPHDADDAWSATFLSALRAYPRLRPGSDVRGWLVTIAHRRALDQLRARGRAPLPVAEAADPSSATDRPPASGTSAGTDPFDALGPAARSPELWARLRGLPERQRAAVALHHVGGLRYAEVAALTDTTEAAARRAAADGVAALRRWFDEEATDGDAGPAAHRRSTR